MKLCVKNLSFGYGDKEILHNIDFQARSGEFISLLGANGVGKSTLFKCVLGLAKGFTGEVTLDGRNIKEMDVREIASCIAYIPQTSSPAFNFSVEDIVLMGTTAGMGTFAVPGKAEKKRTEEALEKMQITHLRRRCFHHLSGGERQMVVIARALAQNANILLLDEPTSALDFGNQILVLTRLRELADEGFTILQTTHNPEHSYMFSDRIIALKEGRILKDGQPDQVLTEEIMGALYDADIRVASLDGDRVRVCLPG